MTIGVQVTFDCADPDKLAHFWAELLGYELDPPPPGFDSWEAWLTEQGIPEKDWNMAEPRRQTPTARVRGSSSSVSPSPRTARTACTST